MKKLFLMAIIALAAITIAACGNGADDDDHDHGEGEIGEFQILDRRNDEAVVAYVHGDHWDGSLPNVEVGSNLSLGAYIESEDGQERELDGSHNGFTVELADGAPEGIVSFALHGDHVHINGESVGITQVVFSWTHDGEVRYTTPAINIQVVEANDHDHDHGEGEIGEFQILDRRNDEAVVAYVHGDHWHGSLPNVEVGSNLSLGAYIESEDGQERELDGSHNGFTVELADGAPEGIVSFALHGDHVHINGESVGITQVVFSWTHDGEVRYTTPAINIQVVEANDHDHGEGEIGEFQILDRRNDEEVVAYVHGDHWHGSLSNVEVGSNLSLGAYIESEDGQERELDGSHNGFTVELADGAPEGIVSFALHGDHVHINGESVGITQVVFSWTHDGEVRYTTPAINIQVVEANDHDHDHGEGEIGEFQILDRRNDEEVVAYVHGDHWHGSLPNVEVGSNLSLGAYIESEDGQERELDGSHNGFTVELADGAPEGIVSFALHGDHVHINGESVGITQVVFSWTHDGEVRYTTPPINVEVIEAD